MTISSTQSVYPAASPGLQWAQANVEAQQAKTGTVREPDQALVGFMQALDAKLREQGIDPQKVNTFFITMSLGFHTEELTRLIEEANRRYPLDQNKERNAAAEAAGIKPTDDPVPQLVLGSVATVPQLMRPLVTNQAEMIARLQEYYNPYNTLASNPKGVSAAYGNYVSEYNAWISRNGGDTISRSDFDSEIQRETKFWTEQRDVYAAALEVAKSFDFFAKHEFTA